jgi:hypothetical protein
MSVTEMEANRVIRRSSPVPKTARPRAVRVTSASSRSWTGTADDIRCAGAHTGTPERSALSPASSTAVGSTTASPSRPA